MSSAVAPAPAPDSDVENPASAKDGGDGSENSGSAAEGDKIPENSWREYAMGGMAAVAVGASVGAMVIVGGPLVIAAGASGCVIAPYSYYQQRKLVDINALLGAHMTMKKEVDHYRAENERLEESIKELASTIQRLEEVEGALSEITKTQGQSVEDFAKQVEQNRKILKDMRKNLKTNVKQNLLSVLVRSDMDGDGSIDASEVENLIKRIQNVNGLNLNVENFRTAIVKSGGSLKSIMDIVKDMLTDNPKKPGNNIFEVSE